jgi:hypothetical protein
MTFQRSSTENLVKKSKLIMQVLKSNTIDLFSKKDFLIIAFFTLLGAGGVFAATLITITTPDSQGAAYTAATACDENVTVTALTASDAATGQLYVATIALSDVDQTPVTGCGYRNAEVALKINGQMSYASWTIIPSATNDTFSFTGATFSINNKYANTLLTPFQADGLTNVAVKMSGGYKVGDTGPGGGVIFYASTTGFNCGPNYTATGSPYNYLCYYLELAPAGWNNNGTPAVDVGNKAYSSNESTVSGQDRTTLTTEGYSSSEKANWRVGMGQANTAIMKVSGATSTAQDAVLAYAGRLTAGSWYLPSMNELNELCKWARGQLTGNLKTACDSTGNLKTSTSAGEGFLSGAVYYWSSTEFSAMDAWSQLFTERPGYGQYPGLLSSRHKSDSFLAVRPIRAF